MAIEMWFREDMRNILLSINASSASTARWTDSPAMGAYRQGYQEALLAVALACGISPKAIGLQVAQEARSDAPLPRDARSPGREA